MYQNSLSGPTVKIIAHPCSTDQNSKLSKYFPDQINSSWKTGVSLGLLRMCFQRICPIRSQKWKGMEHLVLGAELYVRTYSQDCSYKTARSTQMPCQAVRLCTNNAISFNTNGAEYLHSTSGALPHKSSKEGLSRCLSPTEEKLLVFIYQRER